MSTHIICFKLKINIMYPCKPQFYNIKVLFKGGQNYIGRVFVKRSPWLIRTLISVPRNFGKAQEKKYLGI